MQPDLKFNVNFKMIDQSGNEYQIPDPVKEGKE